MLARHLWWYGLGRAIPGIINFGAIALYTRLLRPEQYGHYALVIASIGLFNVVFFQWIRVSVLRFLPSYEGHEGDFLAGVLRIFAFLCCVSGTLGILVYILWPDVILRQFLPIAIPLLWIQGWYELNLEISRSSLRPKTYGLMSVIRATAALAIGGSLAFIGAGAFGPLAGLALGMLSASFLTAPKFMSNFGKKPLSGTIRKMMSYGLPLTATFALAFVVSASDRMIIGILLGSDDVGRYSASYDIAFQIIALLMVIVSLADYPLTVRAHEKNGADAARKRLKNTSTLLLAIGLPGVIILSLLPEKIAYFVLGNEFRTEAATILPWIAFASLLAGFRAFYVDLSFQLGQRTYLQVVSMATAAATNLLLNFILIPRYGLMGAVYATVAAFATALALSTFLSHRAFRLPHPPMAWFSIALAGFIMAFVVWRIPVSTGIFWLMAQIAIGLVSFYLVLFILNTCGVRTWFLRWIRTVHG